jgi:hypothetical protein
MMGRNCIKWLFLLSLIFAVIQTVHLRPLSDSEGESEGFEVIDSAPGSGFSVVTESTKCPPGYRRKSDRSCVKQHHI